MARSTSPPEASSAWHSSQAGDVGRRTEVGALDLGQGSLGAGR